MVSLTQVSATVCVRFLWSLNALLRSCDSMARCVRSYRCRSLAGFALRISHVLASRALLSQELPKKSEYILSAHSRLDVWPPQYAPALRQLLLTTVLTPHYRDSPSGIQRGHCVATIVHDRWVESSDPSTTSVPTITLPIRAPVTGNSVTSAFPPTPRRHHNPAVAGSGCLGGCDT